MSFAPLNSAVSVLTSGAYSTIPRMPAIERGIGLTVAGCERLARVYSDLARSSAHWSERSNAASRRLSSARQAQSDFMAAKRRIAEAIRIGTLDGRIAQNDPAIRYFFDVPADGSTITAGGERSGIEGLGELTIGGSVLLAVIVAILGATVVAVVNQVLSAENRGKQIDAENATLAQDHAIAMQAWQQLAANQVASGAPALPPLPEMPAFGRQDSSIADAIAEGAGAGFGALLPILLILGLGYLILNRKGRR